MTERRSKYLMIYLLIIAIMGAGIFSTYHVMVKTTAWPAPAPLSFDSTQEKWEFHVLGLQYNISKEEVKPAVLKAKSLKLAKQFVTWSESLLNTGAEFLHDASNMVLHRLYGE